MHISFLIHNAFGFGGTIRTTINLANALAEQHDVEIVSVHRHRDSPVFPVHPQVGLRHLVDLRKGTPGYEGDLPEYRSPAAVFPKSETQYPHYSALTDQRIAHHLSTLTSDVIVGTRPGLNAHICLQAKQGPLRVGQEHLTFHNHPRPLRRALRRLYPRLDMLTTTTLADADTYRKHMTLPGVRIEAFPNPVPAPLSAPPGSRDKAVVAAGRLVPTKRYDLLIRAFDRVRADRPDWVLRIFGPGIGGGHGAQLQRLIEELGLEKHASLMGAVSPLETEWLKAGLAASASDHESFGMTIVEAMRCGVPVVSTDCPLGPREIISDGIDGRLVPMGDEEALAQNLLELINSDELRQRMAEAARISSARYEPALIAARFADTCAQLTRQRGTNGALKTVARRTRGSVIGAAYGVKDAVKRRFN
ncbi:glycosyltransferase [Streptomyces sp. BA2]|uniref:glycosyltransferase n=1 Tax=Streptomyces sp. BA2 TaxID=436595 RepID=UPI001323752A|nr:glycosyltransferase [Streptomyces sp. BA2]MWA08543.1 glycosyltransferase [Streptomyces sp. BA2]